MSLGAVRAICFDLDNTLWEVGPVLARAESILADWLHARYPRIPQRFAPADMLEVRAALLRERPDQGHDFTFLRRETLARLAEAAGYERAIAHEAFALWHAARNQCVPFSEVVPALEKLGARFRLATLSNGNADLGAVGLAHHFEISLHAAALGCAKPDARAYAALADALTLKPAEILFVGDDPQADVAGPRNVGMQTVWLNRGAHEWPAELLPADHVLADLDGLVALFHGKTVNRAPSPGDS
jgi:FMN hydrolase / 5-amino-6-(5-phospho-D-ribitylamino)uracil phosphatase